MKQRPDAYDSSLEAEDNPLGFGPIESSRISAACDDFFRRRGMRVPEGNWRQQRDAHWRAHAAATAKPPRNDARGYRLHVLPPPEVAPAPPPANPPRKANGHARG